MNYSFKSHVVPFLSGDDSPLKTLVNIIALLKCIDFAPPPPPKKNNNFFPHFVTLVVLPAKNYGPT